MAIKKRTKQDKEKAVNEIVEKLVDKPYGQDKEDSGELTRTTISISTEMLYKLEDLATKNKREKNDGKSVSALVRAALDEMY